MERDYITEFLLPWPPSTNNFKMGNNKRRYLSPQTRAYRKEVTRIICVLFNGFPPNLDTTLSLDLYFLPPTRRKYDSSNFLKQFEDALMAAKFLKDDSQIYHHNLFKYNKQYHVKGVYVEAYEMTPPEKFEFPIEVIR